MRPTLTKLLLVTTLCAGALSPAVAGQRRHHFQAASPYDGIRPDRYYGYYPAGGWEGAAIARATVRAQNEPGVTSELSPFAKQTATGGPVGGVPGFSGGF